jgi:hypothetical protein
MKFWRGNSPDAGFEMPAADVAAEYLKWAESEGVAADHLQGLPIERSLRHWLTSEELFNSVWEKQVGEESFTTIYFAALDGIYGTYGDAP